MWYNSIANLLITVDKNIKWKDLIISAETTNKINRRYWYDKHIIDTYLAFNKYIWIFKLWNCVQLAYFYWIKSVDALKHKYWNVNSVVDVGFRY